MATADWGAASGTARRGFGRQILLRRRLGGLRADERFVVGGMGLLAFWIWILGVSQERLWC